MEWPGVLQSICQYLDEPERGRLAEYYQFFKEKTDPLEARITPALDGPGEKLFKVLSSLSKKEPRAISICIELAALEGRLELAEKLEYYFASFPRDRIHYTSRERYEQYQRAESGKFWENTKTSDPWFLGYRMLLFFHEVEAFREQGVALCCDNRETRQAPFTSVKSKLTDSLRAFEAAYIMVSVGLYDRARHYLGLLHHYLTKLKPSQTAKNQAWAREFEAMTLCLEELILAHETPDPEQAKRHAARAILAQWRAVVDNWETDPELTHDYQTYSLILSVGVAVEFEFDPAWSRECCRGLLRTISVSDYHPAFFKAMEWDAWLRLPEERGWLDTEELYKLNLGRWTK